MKYKLVCSAVLMIALIGVVTIFAFKSSEVDERILYDGAPIIELNKIDEFYDPDVLHAAQGMRAYGPSDDIKNGILAMASGYLNGADLYDLSFRPVFTKPYNDANGNKTLFADVLRLKNGNFAYTDFKGHRIVVLNADGDEVAKWGEDYLQLPIGVDQFDDGRILVVDYGNDKLRILSSEGVLLNTIDTIENEKLDTPYDIRIYDQKIYLVDRTKHRILILDNELNLLKIIEKSEDGRFYFNHPQHIDFDSQGRLYVMDTKSKSVKVFDVNAGKIIASLTHPDIFSVRGITIDNNDRIYLAGFKTGYPEKGQTLQESHAGIMRFEKISY